jgi:TRAP-type C4-dicarboxylate transport system substrate-binding protein
MRASLIVGAALAVSGVGVALPAPAQVAQLTFATTNPPVVPVNREMLRPWAERINAQGKGTIAIEVIDGHSVANPVNYFDRVANNVVQIAWGLQGVLGEKYALSGLTAGAELNETTESRSVAFWRLYKSGLLDAEYADTVPLALIAFPASAVHMRRPVPTLDNLGGQKLIVSDKLAGAIVENLKATPVSLALQDSYSALQRGVVDGLVIAWSAVAPFKLNEVTSYHVDAALSSGTGYVFMMKSVYQGLPEAARKVIDANSGETYTRSFGAFWDAQIAIGRGLTEKAEPKHTIVRLAPAQGKIWLAASEQAVEARAKALPGGEKVLATYRDIVAKGKK